MGRPIRPRTRWLTLLALALCAAPRLGQAQEVSSAKLSELSPRQELIRKPLAERAIAPAGAVSIAKAIEPAPAPSAPIAQPSVKPAARPSVKKAITSSAIADAPVRIPLAVRASDELRVV